MARTNGTLTLEEIGALANVSRSTVSRVLNDHPSVRPEVRARVAAVIAETGFQPNRAARALASNRTGMIGLVMPTGVDELFGDPYYSALVHGIQDGCTEHGSLFAIVPVYETNEAGGVLGALGFVDGVVVTAGPDSDRLVATLRDRGERMVVVGHPSDDRGVRRVDVENRAGSAAAVDHLVAVGCDRIGFVGPPPDYVYAVERLHGYRDALARAGRPTDDDLVRLDEPTELGGHRAAVALLERGLDGVHVATDTMAVGAMWAIAERGLGVPDDVAVVGFDGLPRGPVTDPRLSTVVQPVAEVGRTAVRLLLADDDVDLVTLPTTLRPAASSTPRPR